MTGPVNTDREMRCLVSTRLTLLSFLLAATLAVAYSGEVDGRGREELSEEDFLVITDSGEDEKRAGRGYEPAAPEPSNQNNPVGERGASSGGAAEACLPICTPGDCLPICTPGARNTTAAPTNGTTALPRAFLRKLIQAGYRVVPPAKYGGPPEQALGLPGMNRGYGMPPPAAARMGPFGAPSPWGVPAPFPGAFPGYPPAPMGRVRSGSPGMPPLSNFGVQINRMPGAPAPYPPPVMRGGFAPAPHMPPPGIIGYPQAPRYPPPGFARYPPRRHRQALPYRNPEDPAAQGMFPQVDQHHQQQQQEMAPMY